MKNKNKVIKRKGIGVSVNCYEKLISEKRRAVAQTICKTTILYCNTCEKIQIFVKNVSKILISN
jgi:hypothetical protein